MFFFKFICLEFLFFEFFLFERRLEIYYLKFFEKYIGNFWELYVKLIKSIVEFKIKLRKWL